MGRRLSGASATPSLTFNLGGSGSGDTLSLSSLSFTGTSASGIDIGFASANGTPLSSGVWTLATFTNPTAGSVTGLDVSNAAAANRDFFGIAQGNLSSLNGSGAFAWTFDHKGYVTGLTYSFTSGAAAPEPNSVILLLTTATLVPVTAYRRWRRKKTTRMIGCLRGG